jgi:hypothetical protein
VTPASPVTHVIDTDVLEHIRFRPDSAQIYSGLISLAQAGTLKTVRQVFAELKKHKAAHAILGPHEKAFLLDTKLQFCVEVQGKLDLVRKHAGYLWAQTAGKNPDPADPWLIAVAAAHGYTLVTNESQLKLTRIPMTCRKPEFGVQCISGPHYLLGSRIVQEIKPEHVAPYAFFGINNGAN